MINFKSYCSGSTGNFHIASDGDTNIALDFGITINQAKKMTNYGLSRLDGIVATHSHGDHCKGIPDAIKAGIDVYTTKSVIDHTGISGHRVHEIKPMDQFKIGTMIIKTFQLEHDVPNVGFMIQSVHGGKLVYITDTHFCKYKFPGTNIFVVECNYSHDLLNSNVQLGAIHPALVKRIKTSHFALENVKKFLEANDLSCVDEIHLVHVSYGNGNKDLFKSEIQALTGKVVVCE